MEVSNCKRNILIVDDDADVCWALEFVCRKLGFHPRIVHTGSEALGIVKCQNVDLIFLDVKLLDANGLELAEKIVKLRSDVVIVVISGYYYADDEAIREAINKEIIHKFIPKPFKHDVIAACLHQANPNQISRPAKKVTGLPT